MKKISLWTILIIVATVLIIPVLLYIPAIQEFAKNIAVTEVKKATGMDITLDRISLKFPLRLSLDRLIVIEASGDTMATARQAAVDVRLLPLFKGEIAISGAELDHASYRLGTPDSAMFLKARIEKFKAENTDLNFSFSKIDIGNAALDGADISLVIKDTVTDTPVDTTAANPMLIKAGDIALSRVRFRMSMLPVIDSLGTYIGIASLKNGIIDTGNRSIDVGSLSVDSVTATYLTPSAQWLKTHPQTDSVKPATADSIAADILPWTITARQLSLTAPMAIYAMQGSKPMPGLDMNYIQASRIALQIDSFYNRGTEINVPIKHFSAEERCGITLNARGTFAMDSSAITVSGFDISTLFSHLKADAEMGLGDLTKDPALPLKLITTGTISPVDITAAMPSMRQYFRSLPKSSGLNMDIDINGTAGALDVNKLKLELPHHLSVNANGHVDNPMDFKRMKGKIDINGNLRNANFIKPTLLDAKMARTVNIPPTTIKGTVDYNPGLISGNIAMRTGSGRMAFNGRWNSRAEGYDATLGIDRFPVASFLPTLSIGDVTAHASVNGNGYNPSNRRTHAKARIDIDDITYQGQKLTDLSLDASLDTCRLTGTLASRNPDADLDIDFAATLLPDEYEWDINGDVRHLDMQQLKLSSTPMNGMLSIYTNGTYNPRNGFIDGEAEISNLHWTLDKNTLSAPEIKARLLSTDTLTQASVNSGDLAANLSALCPLDSVLTGVTAFTDTVMRQIDRRNIDVVELQHTLPHMALDMTMGKNNIAADYIADLSGTTFKNAALTFSNDSLLSFRGDISGLVTGSTRLDNIALSANQHGRFLVYHAAVDNKPGTMDNFAHIKLNGFIAADKLSALLKQSNIRNEEGFMIGFNAAVTDSALNVRFVPYKPTIAYKKWDINHDNSVTFNFAEKHLDANLKLMSGDSYLHLYTEHLPDSAMHTQEDVVLQLANINLAEWLSISPFAPPVKGMADADMRFRWDEKQITGNGMVNLTDIYYGRDRVGTFTLDLDVANDNRTGALNADVSLMVDSVKVITATGALNDSTARNPFLLDFSMIRFPLRVVNPFLPKGTAQLSGMLNGRMDITGSMAQPIFNGYLDFDSTAVKVGITGASYKFSEEKIPVDSNIVRFTDFTIGGLNGNDLHVNGTVDARRLSDIQIDLDMRGRDMQIINSSRPRGADAYGKAFIDLDASVKGNMDMLNVNAMLNVLAGTNVTYILSSDAQSALSSQKSEKMVRFVNFADTTQVIDADSITSAPMSINLEANLIISEGSTINVDLSTDGKNKVSLQSNGNLTFTMNPMNDGRLTGRLNIDKGFARYTPPFLSEKNFSFQEGSYVAFNGDMLNPTLNIHATEKLKANVTQEGQNSRLVNFDIILNVTNTLQNMNVAFDLSTNDDLTIQNELSSMSPEPRANQAMNMLLYNVYTGPGTKANANLSGNPLFSFLESQINSWAANNIRGVDISFGIDQYDTTTDGAKSTTTSYSYRVSKSLFNDRFKIVVGGNYSTDADADENFSQNLINDIAFEYMLNRSGSMYVRLFRHVGFESILEGEITQTGVGFVLKRKLNSLRDLFRRNRKPVAPAPQVTENKVTQPENKATDDHSTQK